MSSIDLIKAFEKAGIKPVSVREFKFDKKVHKEVQDFLKAKERWEKKSQKCNLIFKGA